MTEPESCGLEMVSVRLQDLTTLQEQADQVAPALAENKRLRAKLAAAEKRLENLTAAMRASNPLTPFDFHSTLSPETLAGTDLVQQAHHAHQANRAIMPSVPPKQLAQFKDVQVVVSRGALQGWVEQASPACGAASVAGAWNAVKPADAARATKEDVLTLYANKWRQSIAQSCDSLAQVLQVPDASALHRAIEVAWPFTDQTWVEGEPVKGASAKPAKPTKAAALQLLQQLVAENSRCMLPLAPAGMSPDDSQSTAVRLTPPHAEDTDGAQQALPQPTGLAQDCCTSDAEGAASPGDAVTAVAEEDSQAAASPRGGVAEHEEDDRQAPAAAGPSPLLQSVSDAASQQPYAEPASASTAGNVPCDTENRLHKTPPESQPYDASSSSGWSQQQDKMQRKSAKKQSLAKHIKQQRRRMSRSSLQVDSQPQVMLALTDAQQQQLQLQDSNGSSLGADVSNAATGQGPADLCCTSDLQQHGDLEQPAHQCSGISAQPPQQASSASLAASGNAGQNEEQDMLWRRLSECLQDEKLASKLASLTLTLLARMRALWNLTKQRPSTAPVGNDALMAALRQLGTDRGEDLAVWKFMSAGKQRAEFRISKHDSPETVQEQWQGILKKTQDSNSAFLYHLENHYCLVFAARSWIMDAGYSGCKQVQQILVSRPGQKPCAWVSFQSLRSSLLSWNGYALMAVTRRQSVVLCPKPTEHVVQQP